MFDTINVADVAAVDLRVSFSRRLGLLKTVIKLIRIMNFAIFRVIYVLPLVYLFRVIPAFKRTRGKGCTFLFFAITPSSYECPFSVYLVYFVGGIWLVIRALRTNKNCSLPELQSLLTSANFQ